MNKVRAGVIGVGRMGTYHVGILSELDKVELSAVVDIDSKSRQIIEKIMKHKVSITIVISTIRSMLQWWRFQLGCITLSLKIC